MTLFLGLISGFATAILQSADDLGTKYVSSKFPCTRSLALAKVSFASLILFVVFSWIEEGVQVEDGFFFLLIATGLLNATALYFQTRALQVSDVSLVAPLQLLTPLFLLVTSPIMLGERMGAIGVVGVLAILTGVFLMGATSNADRNRFSLSSFFALLRDRGARAMLITASIWSVTSNLDRLGVESSSPLLWTLSVSVVMAAMLAVSFLVFRCGEPHSHASTLPNALIPGVANAGSLLFQMYAITFLPVPYVIALKRTSALLTVIGGKVFFGEDIGPRLLGVGVMIVGAILILWSL